MKIVIFDGPSGSGKTTLRRIFFDKYQSSLLVIDRFTPSNWVFNFLRGIDFTLDIQKFEEVFNKTFSPIVFILMCRLEELQLRISRRERKDLKFSLIDEINEFGNYYYNISKYSRIYLIDSDESVDFVAKKVEDKVRCI